MAVTVKGFQGTVSDADMATQIPQAPGVVVAAGDLAVSAVNGARQVSVAAGSAVQHFVRYISDAAQTLTLAPPSSGGKWYLVALNRQWSPTNTCTLEAVDVGSTTDGTVPLVVPAATITATAAVFRNNPGTAGSTSAFGSHQSLALVHVRAADTTLTIFDLRGRRTGSGGLALPTLVALMVLTGLGHFLDGALATVLRHTVKSGGLHIRSTWQRESSAWLPVGVIETDNTGAVGRSVRDDVTDVVGSVPIGTLVTDRNYGALGVSVTMRWSIPFGQSAAQAIWRPWDSDWIGYNVTLTTGAATNVYETHGRYRFRLGRVLCEGGVTLNGAMTANYMRVNLPVTSDGWVNNAQLGSCSFLNASDGYRRYIGALGFADNNTLEFLVVGRAIANGYLGLADPVATSTPFTEQWAQSDQIHWSVEYDPTV